MKKLLATVAISASVVLGLGQSAFAEFNWMREYVQLRVHAQAERAVGYALPRASSRIVGGTVAAPASNKFQVGLLNAAISDYFQAQFCGGTLVASRYVVTAAHCVDTSTPTQVDVLTGTRLLDGSGVRRDVIRIWVHPSWNPSTFDYDVAVLKLATSAPGPFATLAPADPPTGTQLLATGWGSLTGGNNFPIDLRQVKVPLAGRANCNDANSYSGNITARMICAGFNAGGKDTCQGDSGGPLTQDPAGAPAQFTELLGITSWGNGCALANFFGVYTRVSHASIANFIDAKVP